MRIALVTEYYYPHLGGVTEHVHNLALELERQGHPTIVVTANMGAPPRSTDPHELVDPAFVRRVGTSRTIYSAGSFARITTGASLRRDLRALFRRERIDVVHVHGGLNPTLGLIGPTAADDLGVPVVATFHSWFADSVLLSRSGLTLAFANGSHSPARHPVRALIITPTRELAAQVEESVRT